MLLLDDLLLTHQLLDLLSLVTSVHSSLGNSLELLLESIAEVVELGSHPQNSTVVLEGLLAQMVQVGRQGLWVRRKLSQQLAQLLILLLIHLEELSFDLLELFN